MIGWAHRPLGIAPSAFPPWLRTTVLRL